MQIVFFTLKLNQNEVYRNINKNLVDIQNCQLNKLFYIKIIYL